MDLWTIQLGKWRKAQAQGIEVVNVTLASGIRAFAPTPEALRAYRLGVMSSEEYRTLYVAQMRLSFVQQRSEWELLKTKQRAALACYCAAGAFCHRHIFSELLSAYLTREGIPVVHHGEIT